MSASPKHTVPVRSHMKKLEFIKLFYTKEFKFSGTKICAVSGETPSIMHEYFICQCMGSTRA